MIVVDDQTSATNSVTSLLSSVYPGSAYYGVSGNTGADPKETIWLCKICGEQREMWKKSGAWFFKVGIGFILIRGSPRGGAFDTGIFLFATRMLQSESFSKKIGRALLCLFKANVVTQHFFFY